MLVEREAADDDRPMVAARVVVKLSFMLILCCFAIDSLTRVSLLHRETIHFLMEGVCRTSGTECWRFGNRELFLKNVKPSPRFRACFPRLQVDG